MHTRRLKINIFRLFLILSLTSTTSQAQILVKSFAAFCALFTLQKLPVQSDQSTWVRVVGEADRNYEGKGATLLTNGDIMATGQPGQYSGEGAIFFGRFSMQGDMKWMRTIDMNGTQSTTSLAPTSEGGFLLAGHTNGYSPGDYNLIVMEFDAAANLTSAKIIGGALSESAGRVASNSKGEFVLVGTTYSYGAGESDFLVIKFDEAHEVVWTRSVGGEDHENSVYLSLNEAGDVFVAGSTQTYGSGEADVLVTKFNSTGHLQWAKVAGSSQDDFCYGIAATHEGGCIVAGATYGALGTGLYDFLLFELNEEGDTEWAKTMGESSGEQASGIAVAEDGSFAVTGWTISYGEGDRDLPIAKFNATGDFEWMYMIGGDNKDGANGVYFGHDSFFVIGSTESYGEGEKNMLLSKTPLDGTPCGTPLTPTFKDVTLSLNVEDVFPVITSPNITIEDVSPIIRTLTPVELVLCDSQAPSTFPTMSPSVTPTVFMSTTHPSLSPTVPLPHTSSISPTTMPLLFTTPRLTDESEEVLGNDPAQEATSFNTLAFLGFSFFGLSLCAFVAYCAYQKYQVRLGEVKTLKEQIKRFRQTQNDVSPKEVASVEITEGKVVRGPDAAFGGAQRNEEGDDDIVQNINMDFSLNNQGILSETSVSPKLTSKACAEKEVPLEEIVVVSDMAKGEEDKDIYILEGITAGELDEEPPKTIQ